MTTVCCEPGCEYLYESFQKFRYVFLVDFSQLRTQSDSVETIMNFSFEFRSGDMHMCKLEDMARFQSPGIA